MIALGRVGHGSARKERTPEKGQLLRLFFEQAKVHVQRDFAVRPHIERREQPLQLVLLLDGKQELAWLIGIRRFVEADTERFFEQARQTLCKVTALGHDADGGAGKRVTVEQHAVGFGQCLRPPRNRRTAQLRLDIGGK